MRTLNKTILTGAISLATLGLFGNLEKSYGQATKQDSLNNEIDSLKALMSEISANCVYLENPAKKFLPVYYPERINSENLCINTNEKKYYVAKKNEEEGIKDIHKINNEINNEIYEEAWLYLPEKQEWYEIGINSDRISVQPSDIRIRRILEENKDISKIIFYHNHPSKEDIDFPSIQDLFKSVYYDRILPDYKITNKIIAQQDVIEYSLNSRGKEKLLEKHIWWWACASQKELDGLYKHLKIKCTKIE